MTQEEKIKIAEFKKGFKNWLETNDVSFGDAMKIIWWYFFNRKKYIVIVQGYIDGLSFWAAKKEANKL